MRRAFVIALYSGLLLASSEIWAAEPDTDADTITLRLDTTGPGAAAPAEATATSTLTLSELVDIALDKNAQVQIARAQVAQAEALCQLAASQAYPAGNARAYFGGPTPEARTAVRNDISTVTPESLEGDFDFGELGVQLRAEAEAAQPLYTFGKIDNLKAAAGHLKKAADQGQIVTEAELVVNVNRAFWALQLSRTFAQSLVEGISTLGKVLDKIEELLDNDSPQVTENDRLRLKYALSTLEVRLTEARAAEQVAGQAVRLLLAWDQDDPLPVERRELDELPDELPTLPELVAWAKHQRPELRALDQIVKAAKKAEDYRVSNFFPSFFIGGLLSTTYTSNATNQTNPFIRDPFNFFTVALGLGVSVELNIAQKIAELEQAEAEVQVRAAQSLLARQAVDFEVRRLYTEIEAGYQRIAKLQRANRTARGWLTASALAYDIGVGRADELIDAFLAWAASEAELQTTRFATLSRLVEMKRATGRLVGPYAPGE